MGLINVKKANCKNCSKCLKECLVKSIKVESESVKIIDYKCILCGNCILACAQKVKSVNNDISIVENFIKNKEVKTVVSLAPSYIAAFPKNHKKIASAIKLLGFDFVEETAIGAHMVTKEYQKLIEQDQMNNIITTSCPTANLFVTKYYPSIINSLASVVSPMSAHGRLIKSFYGEGTKVIFIGPCLSKMHEITLDDTKNYIDAAISFQQLKELFEKSNICFDEISEGDFNEPSPYSRIYPISQGIVFDLKKNMNAYYDDGKLGTYDHISVSGLERIKDLLVEIQSGNINKSFIEINACEYGCVNGPLMPTEKTMNHKARLEIKKYSNENENLQTNNLDEKIFDLSKVFVDESVEEILPTDKEIRRILEKIGKFNKEQEYDCGSCGYATCREKAIAVYQNRAELYICLPYMSDINETMSNITLTLTPNYIIAVDSNLRIKEFNLAAQRLFGLPRSSAMGKDIDQFISSEHFQKVFKTKKNIYDEEVEYKDLNIIVSQSIVFSDEYKIAIAIMKNITKDKEKALKLHEVKLETVEMAQKVIEKQMMVAQEIASLLGETTAETKVTLNKLKKLIVNGELD